MPGPYCALCAEELTLTAMFERDDQFFYFYWCHLCERATHNVEYKYSPATCPKHHMEHIGMEFQNDKHVHAIYQVDRCDRCGAVRKTPRDTRQAGISGRVEIDDPRVKRNLLPNRAVLEQLATPEQKEMLPPSEVPEHVTLPREAEI